MIRLFEGTLFLGLAGALHIAALSQSDLATGGSGDGAKGDTSITLQAAPETLAALARRWDTPPALTSTVAQPQPTHPGSPPPPPRSTSQIRQPTAPRPIAAPPPEDTPRIDTRPPAPRTLSSLAPAPLAPPDRVADAPRRPGPPQPDPTKSQLSQLTTPEPPQPPRIDTETDAPPLVPQISARPVARPATPRRTQTPKPESTAQPAQRAKGSGARAPSPQRAAKPEPQPAPGPSRATLNAAQAQWGAQIRQSVARAQRYPRGTTARGIVKLRISISPAGRLRGVSIIASSGDGALDRAAVSAVKSARLPRAPKPLTAASYSFNLPLQFARR